MLSSAGTPPDNGAVILPARILATEIDSRIAEYNGSFITERRGGGCGVGGGSRKGLMQMERVAPNMGPRSNITSRSEGTRERRRGHCRGRRRPRKFAEQKKSRESNGFAAAVVSAAKQLGDYPPLSHSIDVLPYGRD